MEVQLKQLIDKLVKLSKYSEEISTTTVDTWLVQQLLKLKDVEITNNKVIARHIVKFRLIGEVREWIRLYLVEEVTT